MHARFLSVLLLASTSAAHAQVADTGVLWRFDMAGPAAGAAVSVGPDGTVYASDAETLYALSPAGQLRWSRAGLGGGRQVDFLADGTVIAAEDTVIHALNPADGTDLWSFGFDGNGFRESIEVGPNVGPDGNIYAVSSTDGQFGLGAFSLTPTGSLRWANEGQPRLDPLNAHTIQPVRFTSDRLIFPFNGTHDSAPFDYGFAFDGSQTLFVDFTCTGAPRLDPLERLLITGACGIEAMHRDGDESYWLVDLGASNVAPVIGADATAYAAAFLGDISAIRPDGSIAWTSPGSIDPTRMLAVRQDVGRLVYVSAGFGTPQSVSAMDPADGSSLWTLPLRQLNGHNELVETWEAPTNGSGSTVYFATRFTSLGAPGAVWAVALSTGCAADFNDDGDVNTLDVLAFLNAWNAGEGRADFNDDGQINTLDVLAFLNAWNTGC